LDLVILMGELPLAFAAANQDWLFRDVPLVFFSDRPVARPANAAGIIAELNLSGTLALATELQPETRNVFVITGANRDDDAYRRAAQEQFRVFEPRLTINYLAGLATDALEARLASLPDHSIVYYLIVDVDAAGAKFHPLEYLDRVTAVANAPVYCWVDSAMGYGIVGGYLKDQAAQTHAIGDLALRVLRGEPPDSIPTSSADLNVPQVDWGQLRRWGISEARVPAGTLIRFREPSAWENYKVYVIAAVFLLLAQSGLIARLLIQGTRRRQAEAQVLGNQAELRRSYDRIRDLGSRLLSAQETERSRIARELHDDISQQMALLEIDLEQLDRIVQGQAEALTHEALNRVQTVAKSVHDVSHRLHPAKLRLVGLVAAVRGLQGEMSHPGIAITFTHENVPPALSEEVTLCLFRIVQEALQNAIKYSRGHKVAVQLRGRRESLSLTIEDDGVGFDVDSNWNSGLGLISMHERLDAVGGTLKIHSRPGAGTRLEVSVPLPVEPEPMTVGV
jgi:signal transduction histidine kinase